MRSLDFTVCVRECANTSCHRRLTEEEQQWLDDNANRQSYAIFDDCKDFVGDK